MLTGVWILSGKAKYATLKRKYVLMGTLVMLANLKLHDQGTPQYLSRKSPRTFRSNTLKKWK